MNASFFQEFALLAKVKNISCVGAHKNRFIIDIPTSFLGDELSVFHFHRERVQNKTFVDLCLFNFLVLNILNFGEMSDEFLEVDYLDMAAHFKLVKHEQLVGCEVELEVVDFAAGEVCEHECFS